MKAAQGTLQGRLILGLLVIASALFASSSFGGDLPSVMKPVDRPIAPPSPIVAQPWAAPSPVYPASGVTYEWRTNGFEHMFAAWQYPVGDLDKIDHFETCAWRIDQPGCNPAVDFLFKVSNKSTGGSADIVLYDHIDQPWYKWSVGACKGPAGKGAKCSWSAPRTVRILPYTLPPKSVALPTPGSKIKVPGSLTFTWNDPQPAIDFYLICQGGSADKIEMFWICPKNMTSPSAPNVQPAVYQVPGTQKSLTKNFASVGPATDMSLGARWWGVGACRNTVEQDTPGVPIPRVHCEYTPMSEFDAVAP